MPRALPCTLLVPLLLVACAAPGSHDSPADPRVRAPFDGASLAGWEGDARFWRVEGGAIVGESTPERPCDATTYLVWKGGEVGDFELELEWRMAAGNSGVQFRSRAPSSAAVAGYQADLEAGPDWTGGLYEQDGRGVVTRRGERVVLAADGSKQVERFADGAELLALVRPGEWNRLRVTAFGPRLTIHVNGELFSETIDLDPERAARRGRLALQLHAGPPMRVEYRGLVLRSWPDAPLHARGPWDVPGDPRWIWPAGDVADGQHAWFVRDLELPAEPRLAELWATCDNGFDAYLGGVRVAGGRDWMKPVRVDVKDALHAGENQLLVRGWNEGSVAGLCLRLAVECADGTRVEVVSDGSWLACTEDEHVPEDEELLFAWLDQVRWTGARELGGLDAAPWSAVRGVTTEPTFAPAADTIHVPDGFRVELLHSVDRDGEGSWVSLACDPSGRLYASDQYGGLFRITPAPGGGPARVERVPIALGEAHGLLWAHDALYAVVSAAGEYDSGLYRARDTDGDDALDHVELLRTFEGDGEHGPHAVVLDADGESLLVVAGNHTKPPEPIARYRRPRNWAEDALLPVIVDPNGHAVEIRAPGGWVARTDRDGREWELVAAGMRNAYDLALNRDGELFTYDSDMEWDVGMPWYRPTRVLHLVSGAEFGWRTGSSKWPADSYDSLPAACDLALGSPTGIVFGDATSFPEPWKGALFALDWAYGKIHAVFLEPDGASYTGRHEVFASGEPFPVTDAVVGPDGALYVTIGGRKAQSGLYRIAWTGADAAASSSPASDRRALERRKALEVLHGSKPPEGSVLRRYDGVSDALRDPDRFVRYAARIALENFPLLEELGLAAISANSPREALEVGLARVHADATLDAGEAVEVALAIHTTSTDRTERLDALRLIEVALVRLGGGEAEHARIRAALDGAYPTGDARMDKALLGLLVTSGADVAERALGELERAETQEDRLAILHALRVHAGPWSDAQAGRLMRAFARELGSVKGGLSARGFVEAMRDQAAERIGFAVEPDGPAEAAAPVAVAARRAFRAWTLGELEPRLADVAHGRDFERGREAYLAASCHTCHRLGGDGANVGPDITGAAGRYSPRDLLVAILEPSREVPDVWRDTELWGEDGLLAVGRVESVADGEIVVRESSGSSVHVAEELVLERSPHRLSRMPESLLDVLELDEVLDLLAYVLAGGDPGDERFR